MLVVIIRVTCLNNGSTVTVRLVLFLLLVISALPCGKKDGTLSCEYLAKLSKKVFSASF